MCKVFQAGFIVRFGGKSSKVIQKELYVMWIFLIL